MKIHNIYKISALIILSIVGSVLMLAVNTPTVYAEPQEDCVKSGGTWGYNGSQLSCSCPAGSQLTAGECVSPNRLCTESGGTWGYNGSQLSCSCPAGTTLTANKCVDPSGAPAGGTTGGSQAVEPTPVTTDCDAVALDRDNCQIINWLVIGINFLSAIAGLVIVASIMISGFQYMTAQDNPGQIEKAKSRIIMTLLALAVFIFMYALLNYLVPGGVL